MSVTDHLSHNCCYFSVLNHLTDLTHGNDVAGQVASSLDSFIPVHSLHKNGASPRHSFPLPVRRSEGHKGILTFLFAQIWIVLGQVLVPASSLRCILLAELTSCRVTQTDSAGHAANITLLSEDQVKITQCMGSGNPDGGKVTIANRTVSVAFKYLHTKTTAVVVPPAVSTLSLES